jgi:hypothetical protein
MQCKGNEVDVVGSVGCMAQQTLHIALLQRECNNTPIFHLEMIAASTQHLGDISPEAYEVRMAKLG